MLLMLAMACAEPSVVLIQPEDGAVLCGEPLTLEVELSHFELERPVAGDEEPTPGVGHIDFSLNGQAMAMIWQATGDIPRVDAGIWLVRAELVGSDHEPLDPPAFDEATIEVDPDLCP